MSSGHVCMVTSVLQASAAFILFLCGAGWLWGAFSRHSAIDRVKRLMMKQATQGKNQPGLAVVMPVKGCRHCFDLNWSTLLRSQYGGHIEFLFVVESECDPAFLAIQQLIHSLGVKNARVLVAGFSTTCSQKIHNLISGIRSCSPALCSHVLCLDDDIALHPHSIAMLVQEMEDHPDLFLVTGYPFDVPAPGSGLLPYCLLVFHLPLLIAFSLSERSHFVWGGCMLFRLQPLLEDRHGILKDWQKGGYSDDLIVASKCGQLNLKVGTPFHAVFPQRLPPHCSWSHYWNYLRRQLYVCDTYACSANKRTNHTMLAAHCILSLLLLSGTILVLWDSLRLSHWFLTGGSRTHSQQMLLSPTNNGHLVLTPGPPEVIPTSQPAISPATDTTLAGSRLMMDPGYQTLLTTPVLMFYGCWGFAQVALMLMTGVVLKLFGVLSPTGPPIRLSQFSWIRVWLGLLVESFVLPMCALYTLYRPNVDWSGVQYFRRKGKVVRVER